MYKNKFLVLLWVGLALSFIANCKRERPPNTPIEPSGPGSGDVNVSYTFSSSATDPDGDNVAIRFDWGDGTYSNWSSFVSSGTPVSMTHSWSNPGTYYVKAQAKDVHGATSNWSTGHQIVISGGGGGVRVEYYINNVYKGTVTDTVYNYESDLKWVGLHSGDFIAIYDAVVIQTQEGDTLWTDDFESYATGSWPTNWIRSGNADAPGNCVIDSLSYSGYKSLQLKGVFGGCWEAIAYRNTSLSKKLIIEFVVNPTGIGIRGCHPHNGASDLTTDPDWTYPGRGLIEFCVDDMHIYGINGVDLGSFSFGQWYKVKIIYTRP